jgi:hypothetical protein
MHVALSLLDRQFWGKSAGWQVLVLALTYLETVLYTKMYTKMRDRDMLRR